VLFSQKQVADVINQSFEPAWQAVRPVPIVRIDFGNGKVITRTLHGNIATYACSADGTILDILPGIYEGQTYLDQLQQFERLHHWVSGNPTLRAERLREYHRKQLDSLKTGSRPHRFVRALDETKRKVERAARFVLAPHDSKSSPEVVTADAIEVGGWTALVEDTRINETERRLQIHDRLLETGKVRPGEITRWLYREVLHADLDDPYLGLGETLFASYPFRAEDESN
jgi:hypothetical protein